MKQKTIEEYIEVIYALEIGEGRAQTGRIASEMNVKPSSATEMLQKLQKEGLLDYKTYAGATLTPAGRRLAQELGGRHRVIASFLKIIGVEKAAAELDACQMEHHVSRETMERLETFVEFVSRFQSEPPWIGSFKRYRKTGELVECRLCDQDDSEKSKRSRRKLYRYIEPILV